jgi:hypothetical protein
MGCSAHCPSSGALVRTSGLGVFERVGVLRGRGLRRRLPIRRAAAAAAAVLRLLRAVLAHLVLLLLRLAVLLAPIATAAGAHRMRRRRARRCRLAIRFAPARGRGVLTAAPVRSRARVPRRAAAAVSRVRVGERAASIRRVCTYRRVRLRRGVGSGRGVACTPSCARIELIVRHGLQRTPRLSTYLRGFRARLLPRSCCCELRLGQP